jgi:MraZ protein
MLIGEYTHTIDDKKRIALPSKFRKEIGKKVVITHGLDNCLFLYSIKEWGRIAAELGSMGMAKADTRGFNRFMLAGAMEVEVDANGRILVPEHLCSFAGIASKAVFAGVYNRVELWNDDRWASYKKGVVANADAMAEKLGDVGAL